MLQRSAPINTAGMGAATGLTVKSTFSLSFVRCVRRTRANDPAQGLARAGAARRRGLPHGSKACVQCFIGCIQQWPGEAKRASTGEGSLPSHSGNPRPWRTAMGKKVPEGSAAGNVSGTLSRLAKMNSEPWSQRETMPSTIPPTRRSHPKAHTHCLAPYSTARPMEQVLSRHTCAQACKAPMY